MSDNSNIGWTDATWGPTLGCTKVSPGCESCYAIRTAHRLAGNPNPKVGPLYEGLTRKLPDGSLNWTGKVNTIPSRLELPLTWKKPRRIFVDSQSDLFHESVPDEFIAAVFGVMLASPWHTYQVLTKRPERMRAFMEEEGHRLYGSMIPDGRWCIWQAVLRAGDPQHPHPELGDRLNAPTLAPWPPSNVWLGVSAENQDAANERIPLLLQTQAAVRFVSAEPLLGPIDFCDIVASAGTADEWHIDALSMIDDNVEDDSRFNGARLDWVITGGESGPNHRPFDQDWARWIRDQCTAADVAFFHKQNGGRTPHAGGRLLDDRTWNEFPAALTH